VIAFVRGRVAGVSLTSVVLEVGGVGLELQCTPDTIATLRTGAEATLPTSMVVREDSLTLFGFAHDEERELFGLLQTVSGIGPRTALATLAVLSPDVLRRALVDGDLTTITRVPGIGRKGAERLVLELRDKVDAPSAAPATLPVTPNGANPRREQVVEALVGLGFTTKPAEQAVDAVLAGDGDGDASTLLRAALTRLGKSR
jgi:holliday junction DNA helicase RuvA